MYLKSYVYFVRLSLNKHIRYMARLTFCAHAFSFYTLLCLLILLAFMSCTPRFEQSQRDFYQRCSHL